MANVTFTNSDPPVGFCHTDWSNTVAMIRSVLQGTVPDTTMNFGPTTPIADNRDKPWFKTNADFTPIDLFAFSNGEWLAKHPLAPGLVMMYEGAAGTIPTLDGGEAGAVTLFSGPFWEQVTQMDARIPIGPGNLPSGTAIPVGGDGGSETHQLTIDEMPAHDHSLGNKKVMHQTLGAGVLAQTGGDNVSVLTASAEGGDDPFNIMPPYRGIYFLRRTARLYRRG